METLNCDHLPQSSQLLDMDKRLLKGTTGRIGHKIGVLTIGVASNDNTKGPNLDELVKIIEGAAKNRTERSPNFKISAKINLGK